MQLSPSKAAVFFLSGPSTAFCFSVAYVSRGLTAQQTTFFIGATPDVYIPNEVCFLQEI